MVPLRSRGADLGVLAVFGRLALVAVEVAPQAIRASLRGALSRAAIGALAMLVLSAAIGV